MLINGHDYQNRSGYSSHGPLLSSQVWKYCHSRVLIYLVHNIRVRNKKKIKGLAVNTQGEGEREVEIRYVRLSTGPLCGLVQCSRPPWANYGRMHAIMCMTQKGVHHWMQQYLSFTGFAEKAVKAFGFLTVVLCSLSRCIPHGKTQNELP